MPRIREPREAANAFQIQVFEQTTIRSVLREFDASRTPTPLRKEARAALAYSLCAIFERQLRLWLAQPAPELALEIRRADSLRLRELVWEVRGLCVGETRSAADLTELWRIATAIRSGAPANDDAPPEPEVSEADLSRYVAALSGFWSGLAPPRRTPAAQVFTGRELLRPQLRAAAGRLASTPARPAGQAQRTRAS